ncbi:imidazolonepropionase-like domain-containing protein [Streptomyces rubiginosohelvolus]|uniref:Aminodeoxyfutalosine deaminase/Imidazolonepropionase-like composite domain-containing protein n=1 Tax=Streptomyces rubiginosohelvolus TaxID=67362 RepID=A0ABW6FAJ8_9ACTN
MLTIHAAPLVLPVGAAAVADGAVAVDGDRIAALGPYEEVAAAHPAARVRRWPGLLTPGLRQDRARELLTRCYHPDPREADELGELPLWGEDFERLAATMDTTRRAGSVRRGLQRMLRHGTTHLAGPFGADDPALRTAVARSGLVVRIAPSPVPVREGVPDLDPFAAGGDLARTAHGPLTVGGRADLAVFDVPDEAALYGGPRPCVATVLAGRLVHRAR